MRINPADIAVQPLASPYRAAQASPVPPQPTPVHAPEDQLALMGAAPLAPEVPPGAPAKPLQTVSVGPSGMRHLEARPDGGHLVEAETGTVAYRGASTAQFLGRMRTFERETEMVIPEGCRVTVEVGGEKCCFSEPGVVLLGRGAEARVDVAGPEPLIVCSERAPGWYRKHLPQEPLYQDFVRMNAALTDGRTVSRSAMPAPVVERLVEGGVVQPEGNRVRWPEVRTPDELRERLDALGLGSEEIEASLQAWEDTCQRRLQGLTTGRVPRDHWTEEECGRLVGSGLLKELRHCASELFWTGFFTEGEVRERLNQAGFVGADAEKTVEAWRKTCRAGYDTSGLSWQKDGVTLYTHRGRVNMWSEQPTEWLVASTSYCGASEPFTVGVSTVRAPGALTDAIAFRELRPAETLHRHPVSEGASQTEAYLVSGGRGALLTVADDGRAALHLLHKGDMAVIEPGTMHAVLAVDGEYEQLVFQVPSTFQYGFRFKETVDYRDKGLDYDYLVTRAQMELAAGHRGTVDLGPRETPGGAPDVLVQGF